MHDGSHPVAPEGPSAIHRNARPQRRAVQILHRNDLLRSCSESRLSSSAYPACSLTNFCESRNTHRAPVTKSDSLAVVSFLPSFFFSLFVSHADGAILCVLCPGNEKFD